MIALWAEGANVFEMRAAVPDLAAFEERLGWLTRVGPQSWLEAMPAKVVAPAEYDSTIKEVLRGIPTPKSFTASRVPNEELVTDRYQVGAQTAGTVSCLWFRQWGQARRTGDEAAEKEAEIAMATSTHWPILRENQGRRLPPTGSGRTPGGCRRATSNSMATNVTSWPTRKAWAAPTSACRCCRER
jgi:hypothetical protein